MLVSGGVPWGTWSFSRKYLFASLPEGYFDITCLWSLHPLFVLNKWYPLLVWTPGIGSERGDHPWMLHQSTIQQLVEFGETFDDNVDGEIRHLLVVHCFENISKTFKYFLIVQVYWSGHLHFRFHDVSWRQVVCFKLVGNIRSCL